MRLSRSSRGFVTAESLVRTVGLKVGLNGNFAINQKENDRPPGLNFLKTHNVVSGGILKKLGGGFWY
jgi:hypothetical protein